MSKKKKNKSTKESVINVRCTEQQKTMLEKIASREGLGISTWLLHIGLVEAEKRQVKE